MDQSLYETHKSFDDFSLAILSEPREAIICTTSPNDSPHSVPAWFLFDKDRFSISTHSQSRRARNILDRPKALIFEEGFDDLQDRVLERYLTDEGRLKFKQAAGFSDDCVMEIAAERKLGWNKSSIAKNVRDSGFSDTESAKWFVPLAR